MAFFDFVRDNFGHAFPLIVAAFAGAAIIIERMRTLMLVYPVRDSAGFFAKIRELVLAGKTGEAVALCDSAGDKPMPRVVKSALLRAHLPENLIQHGLELEVGEMTQLIQKRTSYLATIANVATLLGLLGTILGLIASFEAVGHADAQQKSTLLAAGIATSMNATMFGLGIAIPCMIAYSFLVNKSNRLISELEHGGIRTLDLLKQRYYGAGAVSAPSSESGSDEDSKSNVVRLGRAA